MSNEELEGARLLYGIVAKSGFVTMVVSEFDQSDRTMIGNAMRKSGGPAVAWAMLGWYFAARNKVGIVDATEPWLYPERFADHGQRWCDLNPDAERSAAIARLAALYPEPGRSRIGFQPKG